MILNAKLWKSDNQVLKVTSTTYTIFELGRDKQSLPNVNILTEIVGRAAPSRVADSLPQYM